MIKGISFDFWDTLFKDDSDEEKRRALGLRSKSDERFHLLDCYITCDSSSLKDAINSEKEWFEKEWKGFHKTPTVKERIGKICDGLKIRPKEESFTKLVLELENMEVKVQPDPFEDCLQTLKELSRKYKLAITSDTIFTPGYGIRKILKDHGMLGLFEGFSFSDEVGVSKPHKDIFFHTLESLNLQPDEVIHVGDRLYNDVLGAQNNGVKAVWLNRNGKKESHTSEKVKADFEIKCLRELPLILKTMKN